MSVLNHTPFPAIAFRQYNLAGQMNGVVAVRGTFKLVENAKMRVADRQASLVMSDTYTGNPHQTSCIAQTDLVPYKPGTDITFIGSTFAPGGIPSQSWRCGMRIGSTSKFLTVHGPRDWVPTATKTWRGALARKMYEDISWDLSKAKPVNAVPLDWDRAYGGALPTAEGSVPDVVRTNPLGRGVVPHLTQYDATSIIAPQIESQENPVSDWRVEYSPEGFGFISPWWRQRQQHAGTYDDAWLNERHPLLPADFDFRFWQCAHPDLIVEPWLIGKESFELVNLMPEIENFVGRLPDIQLRMRLQIGERYGVTDLVLDGVHFDMRPDVENVYLTWRAGFPWETGKGQPELAIVTPEMAAV